MAAIEPIGRRLLASLIPIVLLLAPLSGTASSPGLVQPAGDHPAAPLLPQVLRPASRGVTLGPIRQPPSLELDRIPGHVLSVPAPPPRPTSNVIAGLPFIWQSYALDCESAALQMALAHQGIKASQEDILSIVGSDLRSAYWEAGGLRWGDPYATFVGYVDGSEDYLTGYGTYFPPIARAAETLHGRVLRAGQGLAPSDVYDALLDGHPVVLWIGYDYAFHPRHDYVSFDGHPVLYAGPFEHAVTAAGVSDRAILIHDPLAGQIWVDKAVFEQTFQTYDQMAVILD